MIHKVRYFYLLLYLHHLEPYLAIVSAELIFFDE